MADNKDKKVLNVPDKREQNDACISSAEREEQVTKAQPKGNVPALRFPEFSGEWQHILNKELFNSVSEKNKNKIITLILSASQTEGMIERDNIGIDIKFDENSVKNYKIVRKGDYVIHLRSFQGGFAFSELTGICSPAYTILRPNKQLQYGFLRAYFMSKKFINSLRLVTYGIRDGKSISVEEWMQLYTNIPNDKEQNKINKLFNVLDERIRLQNKIIEKLETLIKGIVELAFSHATTSNTLGCHITQISQRNKNDKDLPVLSVSNKHGFVEQSEQFEDRIIASDDTSNYKIVDINDFAYNPARINVGSIARLKDKECGIVSPMYICFRTSKDILPEYLELFFKTVTFSFDGDFGAKAPRKPMIISE